MWDASLALLLIEQNPVIILFWKVAFEDLGGSLQLRNPHFKDGNFDSQVKINNKKWT